MERVSDRAIEIINELHTERLDYESEYLPLIDCAIKCDAYEDTGLEPEEVAAFDRLVALYVEAGLDKNFVLACIEATKAGMTIDRLRKLAEADREGRCVVLPIKIPGWGWYCNDKFPNAISAYFDYPSQVVDCMEDYILRDTKEEAEAALAKIAD